MTLVNQWRENFNFQRIYTTIFSC